MKKKFLLLFLILAMVATVLGAFSTGASAEASAPQMSIAYCNLSFSDNVYIKYAVRSDASDVKLLIWTSPKADYVIGTQDDEVTEYYTENIGGVPHMIFDYTELAAKQMADVVYARAYTKIDGVDYYSAVNKYSILQYAYSKLGKTGTASTNAELKDLLSSMLTYGASAQKYFDYKENRLATASWYQIKVTAGALGDGCNHGLYLPGDKVTLTAPEKDASGVEFNRWVNSKGDAVSTSPTFEVTVGSKNEVYTPVYEHIHVAGSVVVENNVAADCVNAGSYDNVVYCATCGEELGRETVTVPALGHDFVDRTCTACGECQVSEGLEFTSNGDGTCYVSGIGACKDTDLIIPTTAPNGEQVTGIGDNAFYCYFDLTSVTIPNGVTSIGERAFSGCTGLTNINYIGTEDGWHDIIKGGNWDYDTGNYVVNHICNHVYDNDCDLYCNLCGEVREGAGHDYADATCTAPKTCKDCGATSGAANGHSYIDGVCSVCQHVKDDPDNGMGFMPV